MAFLTIPPSWLTVGEAIKKQLFQRIKEDLDDHETRIDSLEGGVNKVVVFNFEVCGFLSNYSASELVGIGTFKAPSNMIITEVKLTILNSSSTPTTSSSAGTLSIDLQKSSDGGATWSTILTGQPSISDGSFNAGAESGLVTFITGGEVLLLDEIIRVNVTSKKDSQGSFLITVYGDLS